MADFIALEVYAGRDRNHGLTLRSGGVSLDVSGGTVTINVKKTRDAKTNILTMVSPNEIRLDDAENGIATALFTDILTDGLAGQYWMELIVVTAAADELKLAEGTLNILP